jgi:hypothetical protein
VIQRGLADQHDLENLPIADMVLTQAVSALDAFRCLRGLAYFSGC